MIKINIKTYFMHKKDLSIQIQVLSKSYPPLTIGSHFLGYGIEY